MADSKITDLTTGNPAQSGDEIPINRGGLDRKVTAASIAALTTGVSDGDKGDVTVSSSGTVWTVDSIGGLTVTTADAGADAILGWDDSASAYENLTAAEVQAIISPLPVANGGTGQTTEAEALGEMTQALTEDTLPSNQDYLLTYDASADTAKKVRWGRVFPHRQATGNMTFYVRTDGSDSNDGSANTSGAAFLTIQRAVDEVLSYNWMLLYAPTISVADGTYSIAQPIVFPWPYGIGHDDNVTVQGNTTTPANVVISCAKDGFWFSGGTLVSRFECNGFHISSTVGTAISAKAGARIFCEDIIFDVADYCVNMDSSQIYLNADISIQNVAAASVRCFGSARNGGLVSLSGVLTFTGSVTISPLGFWYTTSFSYIYSDCTFSGTFTGKKYNFHPLTIYESPNTTLDNIPGSTAGTRWADSLYWDGTNNALALSRAFESAGYVADSGGNELIKFPSTVSSAVNELTISNAATANNPTISATGGDTNVGITLAAQGTGGLTFTSAGDGSTPQFQFQDASNTPVIVRVQSSSADTEGPTILIKHNTATPANNDLIATWTFQGKDSGGGNHNYGQIQAVATDVNNTAEVGVIDLKTSVAATLATRARLAAGLIIGTTTVDPGAGNLRVTNIELGHDTANTLSAASGVLSVEGVPVTMTGKKTLWISAGSMTSRTTSGAEATTREINSITNPVQKFDTAADEGVNFSVAFPKAWNAGTVTYQAFWTAASGSGTVEFELRGGCFANDAAINVTGLGTAVAVSDTLIAADDVHISSESSAITLSNAADDTLAFFELIRDVSDDTLGVDAELLGIKFYYSTNAGNDA
jgi:hypothetical protein